MTHGGQVCMTSNRKWKTLDIVTNTSYDINDSMILKKSCRVILLNVSPSQVDLFNPGSERTTVAVRYKCQWHDDKAALVMFKGKVTEQMARVALVNARFNVSKALYWIRNILTNYWR
eukprot:933108_1